jgi:hypothetical protein
MPVPNPEGELRRAASLIRSRAIAANTDEARRPYSDRRIAPVPEAQWGRLIHNYLGGDVGQHCAALTPAVATAVADWLDSVAFAAENTPSGIEVAYLGHAIKIASAYLEPVDG